MTEAFESQRLHLCSHSAPYKIGITKRVSCVTCPLLASLLPSSHFFSYCSISDLSLQAPSPKFACACPMFPSALPCVASAHTVDTAHVSIALVGSCHALLQAAVSRMQQLLLQGLQLGMGTGEETQRMHSRVVSPDVHAPAPPPFRSKGMDACMDCEEGETRLSRGVSQSKPTHVYITYTYSCTKSLAHIHTITPKHTLNRKVLLCQ
jgi:hypothetical protein